MDKVSIRLEITCSQLVKDYYGKQSALRKCNFLLPLSVKNPLDFFPSIGKSINYICSWTYANVVSTLWKLKVVPGRGRDKREPHALQTQPGLEKPPCIWRHFDHTAQPWGKTDDWAGKEKTSSSKSSSYSQQGKVTIAWAWCSPSPPSPLREQSLCTDWEAVRGEALPSHPFTLFDDNTRLPVLCLSALTILHALWGRDHKKNGWSSGTAMKTRVSGTWVCQDPRGNLLLQKKLPSHLTWGFFCLYIPKLVPKVPLLSWA